MFEEHTHYVIQLAVNPKDSNTFASASMDETVKVWQLDSPTASFTLEGHEDGVTCVDYYPGGDKPHLVSGSDDRSVKIWDYQEKKCVQTLEGHTHNVSAVRFHPELPILVSGSEDNALRIWRVQDNYALEAQLSHSLQRVWSIACLKGPDNANNVAIGYDEGSVVIKVDQ